MFAAGVGYRDKNTRGTERDALEAVKILVDAGLDLHQVNTRGETALHGAADRGADTIVQFLVDHGAELNVKTKQGFTPLDVAMGKASLDPAAGSQATHRGPAAKARRPRRQGREVAPLHQLLVSDVRETLVHSESGFLRLDESSGAWLRFDSHFAPATRAGEAPLT